MWGNYDGSYAITGESAHQLGIDGYERKDHPHAALIAKAFLSRIRESAGTTVRLFSGHGMADSRCTLFVRGQDVRLPLTGTSREEQTCLLIAAHVAMRLGKQAVLLSFDPGASAMRYGEHEWIVAGTFRVHERVLAEEETPFGRCKVLRIGLRADASSTSW